MLILLCASCLQCKFSNKLCFSNCQNAITCTHFIFVLVFLNLILLIKPMDGSSYIYLWRKVGCFVLFCSYEIHWTRMFQIAFLVSLESSRQEGVHGLSSKTFVSTCSAKVLEYWTISSLKIKLNHSWKFPKNWSVPFLLLARSWWAGFNGIYVGKIWI
jgi:hypothetical protein